MLAIVIFLAIISFFIYCYYTNDEEENYRYVVSRKLK